MHPGVTYGKFKNRDGEVMTIKALRPRDASVEDGPSMTALKEQLDDLQAWRSMAECKIRDLKAMVKRWRTIAKCGPDADQIRILAGMAMGGVHAMLHDDGVPKPCSTCPI